LGPLRPGDGRRGQGLGPPATPCRPLEDVHRELERLAGTRTRRTDPRTRMDGRCSSQGRAHPRHQRHNRHHPPQGPNTPGVTVVCHRSQRPRAEAAAWARPCRGPHHPP
jgi:hypothetical protein